MKMGQWPIFSGVSLLLSRLVLPPFLHFSPLLSPSLLLWAFELISAGSARCLIGHEAVCEEEKRVFFFFLYPSLFLPLSSNNSIHIISLCVLRFQFCMPVFTVQPVLWMVRVQWGNMTDQRMLNLVLKWWDSLQSTQKQTGHLREKQLDSHKMRKNKRAKRLKEGSDMSDVWSLLHEVFYLVRYMGNVPSKRDIKVRLTVRNQF